MDDLPGRFGFADTREDPRDTVDVGVSAHVGHGSLLRPARRFAVGIDEHILPSYRRTDELPSLPVYNRSIEANRSGAAGNKPWVRINALDSPA
jgi:hypothetical protein